MKYYIEHCSICTKDLFCILLTTDDGAKFKIYTKQYKHYYQLLDFIDVLIITTNIPQLDVINIATYTIVNNYFIEVPMTWKKIIPISWTLWMGWWSKYANTKWWVYYQKYAQSNKITVPIQSVLPKKWLTYQRVKQLTQPHWWHVISSICILPSKMSHPSEVSVTSWPLLDQSPSCCGYYPRKNIPPIYSIIFIPSKINIEKCPCRRIRVDEYGAL